MKRHKMTIQSKPTRYAILIVDDLDFSYIDLCKHIFFMLKNISFDFSFKLIHRAFILKMCAHYHKNKIQYFNQYMYIQYAAY